MSDRLVQQNAGPAGAEHDRHAAGRRRDGLHLHGGLAHGLARVLERYFAGQEVVQVGARAAAGVALLALPLVREYHADVQANEWPYIGRKRAVGRDHEHQVVAARQADDDLFNARIEVARRLLDGRQHRDFLLVRNAAGRVGQRVQGRRRVALPGLQRFRLPRPGNGSRGGRGALQGGQHEFVGIGKTGLLAADRTHTDALVETEAALANNAVLDGPAFLPADLEIQVGIVHAAAHHRTQGRVQLALVQADRLQCAGQDCLDSILFVTVQAASSYGSVTKRRFASAGNSARIFAGRSGFRSAAT